MPRAITDNKKGKNWKLNVFEQTGHGNYYKWTRMQFHNKKHQQ